MAKFQRRWKRRLKSFARGTGKAGTAVLDAEAAVRNPPKFALRKGLERMRRWGEKPSRQGVVREREQSYNPRTKQWVKRDTRTGKIVGVKKGHKPFKSVRVR